MMLHFLILFAIYLPPSNVFAGQCVSESHFLRTPVDTVASIGETITLYCSLSTSRVLGQGALPRWRFQLLNSTKMIVLTSDVRSKLSHVFSIGSEVSKTVLTFNLMVTVNSSKYAGQYFCGLEQNDCPTIQFSSNLRVRGVYSIKNVTITIKNNVVYVKTDYVVGSNPNGAFFIFLSLNSAGIPDFNNAKYLALDTNRSLNFTLPFSMDLGRKIILAYDLVLNGRLISGEVYPAIHKEFVVTRATTSGQPLYPFQRHLQDCNTSPALTGIEAKCSYASHSQATGFQVMAHQRDEIGKLYVNEAISKTDTASVVLSLKNAQYQITVFSIREESGIINSSVEFQEQLAVNIISTTILTIPTIPTIFTDSQPPVANSTWVIIAGMIGVLAVVLGIVYFGVSKSVREWRKKVLAKRMAADTLITQKTSRTSTKSTAPKNWCCALAQQTSRITNAILNALCLEDDDTESWTEIEEEIGDGTKIKKESKRESVKKSQKEDKKDNETRNKTGNKKQMGKRRVSYSCSNISSSSFMQATSKHSDSQISYSRSRSYSLVAV